MSNYITIKLRRGTAAQWTATNPVLAEGEFGAETDTRKFKIGNGSTAWNSLQYWGGSGGGAADFIDLGDVPASYAGQAGKFVKVNATADGLEFGTLTIAAGDLPSGIDAAKIANGTVSNTEFQYLDGVTSPIQTQFSNRVPYSGASGDVNLGEFGMQIGNLEFDNTPTNTPGTDGSVFWDSGDGTLQLQMKGGATQKIGMNSFARIYNDSGVQLVKGDVVYISGAQGNRIAAKKAQANTESTAKNTFAIVVETIAIGAEGTVITEGPLYQLNTLGLTAGATLYLSPSTAGGYTEIQPQAPDHLVIIGFVERVHASVGSIYVKIANGYELEELHDVDLTESKTTPVDADSLLLQDSADISIWKRLTWANLKATAKSYFDTIYANIVHTHVIADVSNLQTSLDGKVDENAAITGATKTKITYDAKGLVTAGADATTADIADSTNRRYVTDAQQTVIANTSGTNTGDQTITLTGDVTGTGTGSFAATIANKAVTLAKIQDITTSRILGRVTASTGVTEELTGTQVTTLLDTFTSSLKGLAPASGGGTSNFLRADGTWAAPAGGGGGDVTVLDVDNAQTGPSNSTTETAVYSYTLPADFVSGEVLELNIVGQYRNQTTTKTITCRVKLGGTTIISQAPSVTASNSIRSWICRILVYIETPASVQRISYFGLSNNAAIGSISTGIGLSNTPWNGNGHGEATIDLTSAKTLELTVEFSAAEANSFVYAESAQLIRYAAP
jgi:hypothetical protein